MDLFIKERLGSADSESSESIQLCMPRKNKTQLS